LIVLANETTVSLNFKQRSSKSASTAIAAASSRLMNMTSLNCLFAQLGSRGLRFCARL